MKRKFTVSYTVRINQISNIFGKGNYWDSTELLKFSKVLDAKPLTHHIRDKKDYEILSGFDEYE